MATDSSSKDGGSERSTTTRALATLLGVYAALYLGLVGAIHFASSPDAAAAVVPEAASTQPAAPTGQPSVEMNDASATLPVDPDEPDNSRECTGGVDAACIY